ncbi:proline-rich protein 18 [Stegostoma tigrinum]|uniref:proline-rich protein 18 n=1 Tax=Stegostoma tigrinum TaxID=3053191 RepID=UPI00202B6BAD|nr:proline-rich protein 18 [Stegostoma tigrinum]
MWLDARPGSRLPAVPFPPIAPTGGCCFPGRRQEMARGARAGPEPRDRGRRGGFSNSWPEVKPRLGGRRPQPRPAGSRAAGSSSESGPVSRSADSGTRSHDNSSRSGLVESAGEGDFSLSLTPEAVLLIQRRSLERQPLGPGRSRRQCPRPSGSLQQPSSGSAQTASAAGIRSLVKISLLNNQHRYDDVEYEEEEDGPGDPTLHQRCLDWLHGVEEAVRLPRLLS